MPFTWGIGAFMRENWGWQCCFGCENWQRPGRRSTSWWSALGTHKSKRSFLRLSGAAPVNCSFETPVIALAIATEVAWGRMPKTTANALCLSALLCTFTKIWTACAPNPTVLRLLIRTPMAVATASSLPADVSSDASVPTAEAAWGRRPAACAGVDSQIPRAKTGLGSMILFRGKKLRLIT